MHTAIHPLPSSELIVPPLRSHAHARTLAEAAEARVAHCGGKNRCTPRCIASRVVHCSTQRLDRRARSSHWVRAHRVHTPHALTALYSPHCQPTTDHSIAMRSQAARCGARRAVAWPCFFRVLALTVSHHPLAPLRLLRKMAGKERRPRWPWAHRTWRVGGQVVATVGPQPPATECACTREPQ